MAKIFIPDEQPKGGFWPWSGTEKAIVPVPKPTPVATPSSVEQGDMDMIENLQKRRY